IAPIRIHRLYQIDFPVPIPFLQLLFPRNRVIRGFMDLIPDEAMGSVLVGKALDHVVLVLPYAANKIVRHTDVERAVSAAGEDVDAILAIHDGSTLVTATGLQDWIPAYAGMTDKIGFPPTRN